MNEIDITLNKGLKLKFIKSPFMKYYIGIGTKFGGAYTKYNDNGITKDIKPGIAHFLEHMLFKMEDGVDQTYEFDKLNVCANAYTSKEETIYYVSGLNHFFESLELLIKMYFTPIFLDDVIANERKIIIEEYRNDMDDIEKKIYDEEVEALFPNDSYKTNILGNIDSINQITKEDLYEIYNSFYTIDNTYLVIVSNYDLEEIKTKINFLLDNLNVISNKKDVITYQSNDILTNLEIKNDYYTNLLVFQFKSFEYNYSDPLVLEKLAIILNQLFSLDDGLLKTLLDNDMLVDDDYDYNMLSASNMIALKIELRPYDTKKVKELLLDYISKLDLKKIKNKYINEEKRKLLSTVYKTLDDPRNLGDKVLSLWLEGHSYLSLVNRVNELNRDSLKDLVELIKTTPYSILEKTIK